MLLKTIYSKSGRSVFLWRVSFTTSHIQVLIPYPPQNGFVSIVGNIFEWLHQFEIYPHTKYIKTLCELKKS